MSPTEGDAGVSGADAAIATSAEVLEVARCNSDVTSYCENNQILERQRVCWQRSDSRFGQLKIQYVRR